MSTYTITNFNNGQITLLFDNRQVAFPVPITNGNYIEGVDLDALLNSYVEQSRSAALTPPISANNESVLLALVTTPTKTQIGAAIRVQRDQLIRLTDWTAIPGNALSSDTLLSWQEYRQALRNLPSQIGFPTTVTWPIPPSIFNTVGGIAATDSLGNPTTQARIIW